jgi:hypothetical protein
MDGHSLRCLTDLMRQASDRDGPGRLQLITRFQGALTFILLGTVSAHAGPCEKNFKVSGVPLVTALTYRSFQEFPQLKQKAALESLASSVAAEGFSGIRVNNSLGAIDAFQETSGSGRAQTLRVVARKRGDGTRVDVVFEIQAGQVTSKELVRQSLCTIITDAAG